MKYIKQDTIYAVYLEKGDELKASLEQLAQQEQLTGAKIEGIGAVTNVDLGYFHSDTKEYQRQIFTEEYELLSAMGNISRLPDGSAYAHIHMSIGTDSYSVLGGHCFAAEIAVVGEFFVTITPSVSREHNQAIGLNCWALPA